MDAWTEAFRWIGTLVILGLIVLVVAVSLIFEAPRPRFGRREQRDPGGRPEFDRGHHAS